MSKTTFVRGTRVTKEWLNSIQDLQFDGADLDGHYPKIPNAFLDDSPNGLLTNWNSFKNALAVVSTSGLTANYNSGTVTLSSGQLITIASGSVLLANNATNYVFVGRDGVVGASTVYPTISVPLAQITTVGGNISGAIVDLRPRYQILPVGQALKIFGGLGAQGAYNLASGTDTLAGDYYFTDFTVASSATLTISGSATIYCSGKVSIAGTIIVVPTVKGGSAYNGVLRVQDYPGFSGAGFGGGNSINSSPTAAYHFSTSPLGSGGCGGWLGISTVAGGLPSLAGVRGGNGGGNVVFESADTITVTGSILCEGENGQSASSIVMTPPNSYTGSFTGGGGGSGGLIFLRSLKSIVATPAAVLSVKGGAGGNGFPNPSTFNSAGGGGGGYVVCYSPSNNLTGATINLSGGASQYSGQGQGSVSGGSFAGAGGAAGQPGASGLLVLRSIIPV